MSRVIATFISRDPFYGQTVTTILLTLLREERHKIGMVGFFLLQIPYVSILEVLPEKQTPHRDLNVTRLGERPQLEGFEA